MKERPIIFNGDMVRAVLSGQKTQTRRPVKPQPIFKDLASPPRWCWSGKGHTVKWVDRISPLGMTGDCHFGQPGDHLWVRETFCTFEQSNGSQGMAYRADTEDGWYSPCETLTGGYPSHCSCHPGCEGCTAGRWKPTWRPSIHMPRWASRITLEITDVHVERVQDIHEEDAIAEGIDPRKLSYLSGERAVTKFSVLWNSLYAADGFGWDVNPWVWVVTVKRVEEVCPE